MSRRQFGFAVGFFIAWMWAVTGFLLTLGAVCAGVVGYLLVLVFEGEIDLGSITDRFSSPRRR